MKTTDKLMILALSIMLFGYGWPASGGELEEACGFAYGKLKLVSGAEAGRTGGAFIYNEGRFEGCIIKLTGDRTSIADDRYPGSLFYPFENSPSYRAGWRVDLASEADGPDGTAFRIIRGNTFCLVEGRWDGGDDSDPHYVPSKKYEITVRCSALKN